MSSKTKDKQIFYLNILIGFISMTIILAIVLLILACITRRESWLDIALIHVAGLVLLINLFKIKNYILNVKTDYYSTSINEQDNQIKRK